MTDDYRVAILLLNARNKPIANFVYEEKFNSEKQAKKKYNSMKLREFEAKQLRIYQGKEFKILEAEYRGGDL